MLLLDTDICVACLRGQGDAARWMAAANPSDLRLCSVVKAELKFGAWKSGIAANFDLVEHFLSPFSSLSFDDIAADEYARIRTSLEREGRVIGTNDLLIASIALANNLTIVTRNLREFRRVPGLKTESW